MKIDTRCSGVIEGAAIFPLGQQYGTFQFSGKEKISGKRRKSQSFVEFMENCSANSVNAIATVRYAGTLHIDLGNYEMFSIEGDRCASRDRVARQHCRLRFTGTRTLICTSLDRGG